MFKFSKVSITALAAGLVFATPGFAQTTADAPEASPSPSRGVPGIVVTAPRTFGAGAGFNFHQKR
jgi:hypothetical protein